MKPLPVLISIAHAGLEIPVELKDRLAVPEEEIWIQSDRLTDKIYDLGDKVMFVIKESVSRILVDLNRYPDMLPPTERNGVVKSHTFEGRPLYKEGMEPDAELIQLLLKKYFFPYHEKRDVLRQTPGLLFALDCHSMNPVGPALQPDAGGVRPLLTISDNHGETCPAAVTQIFAECLAEAFNLPLKDVAINEPFLGDYMVERHGMKPIPWIQMEINEILYLTDPWHVSGTQHACEGRIGELKGMIEKALTLFIPRLEKHNQEG